MFPFKIGTTSFIYPDSYVQNVNMLAPFIDEIELILFESAPDSLPSNHEITELLSLANEYDLSYNIHLPIDISINSPDKSIRDFAIETMKQVMDLTSTLSPTTYTLHLPYDEIDFENERIKRWKARTYHSMEVLCTDGINSNIISIETLNYPIEWAEEILIDFNLSVCIDLGHLMVYGFDMETVFNRYCDRTSIIHLHGSDKTDDHASLDRLSEKNMDSVIGILKRFTKVVSLEVFSYDHLKASLNFLEESYNAEKL
ncbi:MAG: sugar phosphate isomerase/epimerase [Deltaproteobacteria bacterium]|nr:sugar phosphate isomerase/epimerase [Deltaproteobacteria bacterium]